MKKFVVALATVLAAVAFTTTATADGPIQEERGFDCGVLDRDGSFVLTTNSYFAWYDSGRVYLRCEAQGTPGNSVVQFNYENTGGLCGALITVTDEWKNRVGRNGAIQLTCTGHVNPGDNVDSSSGAGVG